MEVCGDCGITLPYVDTSGHLYLGASPACWALYGEVLAREYSDPAYMAVHCLTVDAYCAQHPGRPERKTMQSLAVHLVGFHLSLDLGLSPERVRQTMAAVTASDDLVWLEPPASLGDIRVDEVRAARTAIEHGVAVGR